MAGLAPAPSLEQSAARAIERAGFHVHHIQRVFSPRDTGDPIEVLFLGHRCRHRPTAVGLCDRPGQQPWTGYIPSETDEPANVVSGW